MKKIHVLFCFTASFLILFLLSNELTAKSSDTGLKIDFNSGYRQDFFQWNIAGGGVNILSELTWEDIQIYEIELKGKYYIKNFFFGLTVGYGWILSGKNQDSDYFGNGRRLEFSRSNNNADKGSVYHIVFEGGYRFQFVNKTLSLSPKAGFSHYRQNFTMTDGFQTIDTIWGFHGAFAGLNSTYEARWTGPFFGLDFDWKIASFFGLSLGFEKHFPFYFAEADWNLRRDFAHPVSYDHSANGHGLNFIGAINFTITKNIDLYSRFIYRYWYTNHGVDTTYFNDGTYGTTQLNEVIWKSFSADLGLSFTF